MNEVKKNNGSVDVFFLGAGKPATGGKPSSLKEIGLDACALDWQLQSLQSIGLTKVHFLGGYHAEEVIKRYPNLHYTLISNWETESILYTLSRAPLKKVSTLITYTDTIFREETIAQVAMSKADVTILYDSFWEERYSNRDTKDLLSAEVIYLADGQYCMEDISKRKTQDKVEFTGVIKLSPKVASFVSKLDLNIVGRSLLDLINYLFNQGYQIKTIDIKGEWAEFNSPSDIAHFVLGSKADTLSRLAPLVTTCHIGKQISFTTQEWRERKKNITSLINKKFPKARLIVRSSAKAEDNLKTSYAGKFESVLDVDGSSNKTISEAVNLVINSYEDLSSEGEDQVLVQEYVGNVTCAGVVLTCDLETGAPYYRINFDDKTNSTKSVTSGTHGELRTILIHKKNSHYIELVEPKLIPVLSAIRELESLLNFEKLDIEFAVDPSGTVNIFQVRPITVDHSDFEIKKSSFNASILNAVETFRRLQTTTPFILGSKSFFGNMPDWNPAEIIGTRPSPLAFSLYRRLITDEVWATQRAEFGYRDVRPHPLIVSFCGQPYVDIRASLNSFTPKNLSDQTAEKIIDSYLNILKDKPIFHDKLEFDVAFTAWTPSFKTEALDRLTPYGISLEHIHEMDHALKEITQRAILRLDNDIQSINTLVERRALLEASNLLPLDKAMALLSDCGRFGSLALAHAARAGFIAISFLKSFVSLDIFSDTDKQAFLKTIKTVTGEFEEDGKAVANSALPKEVYLKRYGHLRPGTYDATVEAYWEAPEKYLFSNLKPCSREEEDSSKFQLNKEVYNLIDLEFNKNKIELTSGTIINYIKKAIQAREHTKFLFTGNLSRALDLIIEHGVNIGLTRKDISFLNLDEFEQCKGGSLSSEDLAKIITNRKESFRITKMVELPQLLFKEADFYCFERYASQPNFVTGKRIEAKVVTLNCIDNGPLDGKIIVIPQADPGYDWLFNNNIAGLITKYGGANSHMAIRAAEMGLPAAIGVGEKLYEQFSKAQIIQIDCANQLIRQIQ
jgi:glutamine kinase